MNHKKVEERKNLSVKKLLVPIISIAVFLVLIGSAAYAYFGVSLSNTGVTTLTGNIPDACTTTFSVQNEVCGFDLDALQMTPEKVNNTSEKAITNCSITATLSAVSGISCTFNVYVNKNSSGSTYTRTSGLAVGEREFTGLFITDANCTENVPQLTDVGMENYATKTKIATCTLSGNSNCSESKSINNFYLKWYNASKDQYLHKGKSYKYDLTVEDLSCI